MSVGGCEDGCEMESPPVLFRREGRGGRGGEEEGS